MTRVPIIQVYRQVYASRIEPILEAKKADKEVVRYSFDDWTLDCHRNELICTPGTVMSKWQTAIADEVVKPINKRKGSAFLFYRRIEEIDPTVLTIPFEMGLEREAPQ